MKTTLTIQNLRQIGWCIVLTLITGCGSSSAPEQQKETDTGTGNEPPSSQTELIKLNQIGYLTLGEKLAVIPEIASSNFSIIDTVSSETVYEGQLSDLMTWSPASDLQFKLADFSEFQTPGQYQIKVAGVVDSHEFKIGDDIYLGLHDAALRYYYYNRSSTDIVEPFAQGWPRAAGHLDMDVLVHASAASRDRPEGFSINSSKGWYDAGDYGKYVVNSGISTYTLMAAYMEFTDFYQNRDMNIPESGNAIPDILEEIKWNMDWLYTMQDIDGGVYHKLTTLDWPGHEMPIEDTRDRYVIGKTTAATLDFAALMAKGVQTYRNYESEYPQLRESWLEAAEKAWLWAVDNPQIAYQQPADVTSGHYGDSHFQDEFAWAAAELYLATQDSKYLDAFYLYHNNLDIGSWANVSTLGVSSLINHGEQLLTPEQLSGLKADLISLADVVKRQYQESEYKIAMIDSDFVWGSNSLVLNKAILGIQAYKLTSDNQYRDAALGSIAYLLGRNPTDYSFVTGFGVKTPVFPHHRISESDGIDNPVPGMVIGGPQNGKQDGCTYPSDLPAKSYLDDWCSYSTNEVTINWNAPLVYVLSALSVME